MSRDSQKKLTFLEKGPKIKILVREEEAARGSGEPRFDGE